MSSDGLSGIVVMRSGSRSQETGDLTSAGRHQVERLAEQLVMQFKGYLSVMVVSSPQACAMQSAAIIAAEAGLDYNEGMVSSSLSAVPPNLGQVHALVDSHRNDADLLILVASNQVCSYYPPIFLQIEAKRTMEVPDIQPGQAVCVDCREGRSYILEGR